MKTINDIPCFRATVDDKDCGMLVVSLVDEPAIEVDFVAFNKDKESVRFSIQSEEEQMLLGAVMVPDKPIYRRKDDGFEYFIEYDSKTIHKMAEKYFKEGLQNNVDTDHNFKLEDGITLVQAFFKDVNKGINPTGFEDLPDDTLFFQYHIENDEVWERVKEGDFKGFSLAGTFGVEPIEMKSQYADELSEILRLIQRIIKQINKIKDE